MAPNRVNEHEASPLLISNAEQQGREPCSNNSSLLYLIPFAFLAAFAIATTAASEIYAYTVLSCREPGACREDQAGKYAGTVALGVAIANISALLVLGPLARLCKKNYRAGLFAWVACRSMSVLMLAVGVSVRSLGVAMTGRVFEGLASDNLLHFNLNSIYVQEKEASRVPRLIGLSSAAYMIGISIGPAMSSTLPSFQTSFYLAIAIFGSSILYLLWIPVCSSSITSSGINNENVDSDSDSHKPGASFNSLFAPLHIFWVYPYLMITCLSLLCYNLVQSFIFAAIMTYTTIHFRFDNKENGYILSIVHTVAAAYLFVTLYLRPRIAQWRSSKGNAHMNTGIDLARPVTDSKSAWIAMLSITFEAVSLFGFAAITESQQVFPVVALIAFGLAAPSYIKSYTASLTSFEDAPQSMAALTMFETIGSVLAPVVVGSLLVKWPGPTVFLVLGGLLMVSVILLMISVLVGSSRAERRYTKRILM